MHATPVSAVILAGGRSVRFGRDKLAELVDGRPLLHHAIDGVRPVVSEIIVVVAPGGAPEVPDGVTIVRDTVAFEGPLAGLLVGLRAAREPIVVVVGGDMPSVVGAVLLAMTAELETSGADAVVLELDGDDRPLPMVLRRAPAMDAAARLVGGRERRLRAIAEDLRARIMAEASWRPLDPEASTIRDVDTPADLPVAGDGPDREPPATGSDRSA